MQDKAITLFLYDLSQLGYHLTGDVGFVYDCLYEFGINGYYQNVKAITAIFNVKRYGNNICLNLMPGQIIWGRYQLLQIEAGKTNITDLFSSIGEELAQNIADFATEFVSFLEERINLFCADNFMGKYHGLKQ